jgi:hypothetical protein
MFGSQSSGGPRGGGHGAAPVLPRDPEKRWLFDVLANKTNGSEIRREGKGAQAGRSGARGAWGRRPA